MRYKFVFATVAFLTLSLPLQSEERPELVVFTAPWCPACQRMRPVIDEIERDGFSVVRIDFDSNKAFATKHHVQSLPTMIVVQNTEAIARFEGMTSKNRIILAMTVPTVDPRGVASSPPSRSNSMPTPESKPPEAAVADAILDSCIVDLPNAFGAWTEVVRLRNFEDWGLYSDLMCQLPSHKIYGEYGTNAHEWTHLVNSRVAGPKRWAFYVGDGRAAVFPPPDKLTIGDVAKRVPTGFRSSQYSFYVVSLQSRNNAVPFVLLDEWCAYFNDVRVQLELIDRLPKNHLVPDAESLAEFCVIGLAVLDSLDTAYLFDNPDFAPFVWWLLSRSLETYDAAQRVDRFHHSQRFMTASVRKYLESRLVPVGPTVSQATNKERPITLPAYEPVSFRRNSGGSGSGSGTVATSQLRDEGGGWRPCRQSAAE